MFADLPVFIAACTVVGAFVGLGLGWLVFG